MRWIPVKTLMTIVSGLLLLVQNAYADDVLVLLSINTTAYINILNSAQKAYHDASTKVVNLAEVTDVDIPQLVRESRAKIVLAMGDRAYMKSSTGDLSVPVIGALVADQNTNTFSYMAPAEMYLSTMKKLGRKNVGVVYGKHLAAYERKAATIAKAYGINLVSCHASSPSDAINRFSLKNGAAIAIEPDKNMMGQEIAEKINSYLLDSEPLPRKNIYRVLYNDAILDQLQLPKIRRSDRSNTSITGSYTTKYR